MKRNRILIWVFLLCPVLMVTGQNPIPKGYFSSPLRIDLSVTGSFGEIRPNHFHSGDDFQVQKKEGLPVYAIADGWVSRIRISPVGFGNALYIDHHNGFTSVFGHLLGYNDTIRQYARLRQYVKKSFEVDLFPAHDKDTLWVKRGELIGYAGNSGSSFGAHLHFELRNTETERTINPMLFGFECKDNYSPYINLMCIYPADDQSFISESNQVFRLNVKKGNAGEYRLSAGDTLTVWGNFSFGVQAFDYFSSGTDRNGWYSVKMYADKAPFFSMQLDSFAFAESRYINASMDYSDNYNHGSRIIQSRRLPGNELSLHNTFKHDGTVTFTDGKLHEIVIAVDDASGNSTVLRFIIRSRKPDKLVVVPELLAADTVVYFPYQKNNTFITPEIRISIPDGSLYDDTWFIYCKLPRRKGTFSNRHSLHLPEVPLQKRITVSINASGLPERLQPKAMLARIDRNGGLHAAGGSYANGFVTTETNQFDSYAIVVDSVPPSIRLIGDRSRHRKSLKFKVSDNFSGIDKYYAEINGNWGLVEWDPKNKFMVYNYDEGIKPGKNSFKLILIDVKGNKAAYSTTIIK